MARYEWAHVIAAVLLLFVIAGLPSVTRGDVSTLSQIFVFSFIVIFVPVLIRKAIAYSLDANVEHRIWHVYQYGLRPHWHFKKEVPFGVIIPLIFTFFGFLARVPFMVMTFLTYETRALKHRAAKRFGYYSYTEMTDWHNGLIGASGIVAALLVSLVAYFPGFEVLSKMAAYYAFWNMLPLWDLDGTQILFGSKILYSVIGIITLIFTLYAFIL